MTILVPPPVTDEEKREALALLRRARTVQTKTQPFYAYCSWRLELVEKLDIATLMTNGQQLFYNPSYVVKLRTKDTENFEYAETEVAHEVLHCVLRHCQDWASRGYVPGLVNVAQDFIVNGMLKDAGYKIHPDWCYDERFRSKDGNGWMSWFEVYDILFKEAKQNAQQQKQSTCQVQPQPSPTGGDGKDDSKGQPCPGLPPCDGSKPDQHKSDRSGGKPCACPCHAGDAKSQDGEGQGGTVDGQPYNNWDRITVEAFKISQSQGHAPGWADELVGTIVKPEVNHFTVIERYMSRAKRDDYSFRRPNKRYLHMGLAMPSLHNYTANVIFGIDTSGSVYAYAPEFSGHLWMISKSMGVSVDVVLVDYVIQSVFRLTKPDDVLKLKYKGGGGTSFVPFFDYVEKGWKGQKSEKPDVLIILTDCVGDYPKRRPPYDVLWCVPGGIDRSNGYYPPFGKVLKIPEKK
jgi:predicted metal-dependent peptidase